MGNLALSSVFTPIGIAHFFYAGVTSEHAWICLVQAHHNCPHFFPLLDLSTVNYWYTLFQNGYLNQFFNAPAPGIPPMLQLPMSAPVQLQLPVQGQAYVPPSPIVASWMPSLYSPNAHMFDPALFSVAAPGEPERPPIPLLHELPVYHKIVHELNGHDQRSLMLVCQEFKNYIQTENRLYRKIRLAVRGNSILLDVKSGAMMTGTRFIFHKTEKGCSIRSNGKITFSEKSPLDQCLLELKKYMEKVNTRIEKFVVSQTAGVEIRPLLGRIAQMMKDLKFKLAIEELDVTTSDFVGFEAVIEQIQLGSLVSLSYNNLDREVEELELSNITSLMAQIKNFKMLWVTNARIDIPLETVAHIVSSQVNLRQPTSTQVSLYKERILQFKSMIHHMLNFPAGTDLHFGPNVEQDEENNTFEEVQRIPSPNKKSYILIEKRRSDYRLTSVLSSFRYW